MSKKNIARSALEGGRSSYNKHERYRSNQEHRVRSRRFSKEALQADVDDAAPPVREKVRKDFTDKLSPAYRWLRSQVGRAWADVYSDLRSSFDTRTTAGRHIIFDHLLRDVEGSGRTYFRWGGDFRVDAEGVLRLSDKNRWSKRHRNRPEVSDKDVARWADGRRVMDYGRGSLFWMVPEDRSWAPCSAQKYFNGRTYATSCHAEHRGAKRRVQVDPRKYPYSKKFLYQEPNRFYPDQVNYFIEEEYLECRQGRKFKQGKRLSAEDLTTWSKLLDRQRDDLLWNKS